MPKKYQDLPRYDADRPSKLGVLLVNLGTPDSPAVGDVRRYLAQFLGDPRVIEVARPLWWLILHGVILRIRPPRSAKAYREVWSDQGSPLLAISRRQAAALQQELDDRLHGPAQVELAMRYGNPSIPDALARLREGNAQRVLVLTAYPQYSATTTASVFDAVSEELRQRRWLPELRFINDYHNDPGYIEVLARHIRAFWGVHGRPKRLLMSFHGIPKRYREAGDPYFHQCKASAELLAKALGLEGDAWALSFQSRVGREEWLKPYTDETLKRWGGEGLQSVQVVCPGFPTDCLETLEEIAGENREYFEQAGGGDYRFIPGLNASPSHMEFYAGLAARHCQGWPEAGD